MKDDADHVIPLKARTQELELERINRLTGLDFHSLPVSLINQRDNGESDSFMEELLRKALTYWGR